MSDFEENASLWALVVPGRDTREAELGMVPDCIKENLSKEGLEKFMHMGVLAYASTSYLVDLLEEIKHVETHAEREKLRSLCFNRVVSDLGFGAEIHMSKDDETNGWIEQVTRDFNSLSLVTQSPVQRTITEAE